jgi:hypothetical protein
MPRLQYTSSVVQVDQLISRHIVEPRSALAQKQRLRGPVMCTTKMTVDLSLHKNPMNTGGVVANAGPLNMLVKVAYLVQTNF